MQKSLRDSFSVFGKTTLRKFNKLKIYVEGLSKIGPDLVTNLVLLNPHIITLHDNELIHPEDPYRTYLYQKDQVSRKLRTDYLIELCHRLNSKVYVDKTNTEITEETCIKYDIIIFCDIYDLGRVLAINRTIRSQKQKTVVMYACQMGYFGLFLSDFGEEWEMYHSGQEPPHIPIKNITNDQIGIVTTEIPHNYQTGDFISINYVEGMKYVNGDARPVRVLDECSFQIEDTRNFGVYTKGGLCQKVNLMEKLRFTPLEQQLSKRHSELMLIAKAIICFFQNNSKLPELFNESHQQQTIENLKTLAAKFDQKYDESTCRNVIKTCDYSFYPMIHMFSAIISLQCVKCTGKYRPIKSPFIVDWYNRVAFQVKKKIQGQFVNIIDTNTLAKLANLQVGIVDDGSQSLELLNLLYSCSIAEKTRVVLCGLESINEYSEMDGIVLKAQIKYQVANELFKNKKTQTIPCSLSFSNDLILSDMWKKIKLLINSSSRLNEYVYNNVIWNQIEVVDSSINELSGELKISSPNKSGLQKGRGQSEVKEEIREYRDCVERIMSYFRLIFIDIFEDMRCFFLSGVAYIDQVKMSPMRKNIFLFTIFCLEDGSHVQPENIVRICKYIYTEVFPDFQLDAKDQVTMDFLKSLFFLIGWFISKKQYKIEDISNYFTEYIHSTYEEVQFSEKQKFQIAYTKLAMGNQFTIPYLSLSQLYRKQYTVKFIWNGSQILAKKLTIDEEITSKKFYKYYFRKIKPCPFITQIINSLIPLSVLESVYNKINNFEIDMIGGRMIPKQCPPPKKIKIEQGVTLVPANSNEWTIILIEGPKKVSQIIDRFNYMENVKVKVIRYGNLEIFNSQNPHKNIYMQSTIEAIPKEKKSEYELHIEAIDEKGNQCEVCRVKYIVK